MNEEKEFTVTIDGPNGYRSWSFTPKQIKNMSLAWRESVTEEMSSAVTNEFERVAN